MQMIELLQHWDFNSKVDIEKLLYKDNGHPERIWLVTSEKGQGYFLKDMTDTGNLQLQHDIILQLAKEGVPVAVPIKSKSGSDVVLFENKHFSLYPALKGQVRKEGHFVGNYLERAKLYGEAIGSLHKGLACCGNPEGLSDVHITNSVLKWARERVLKYSGSHQLGFMEEVFEAFTEGFLPLYESLPRQIIHRDLHPQNFLFEGDALTGFIDFELSQRNVRIFDPCYCATSILMSAIKQEELLGKWTEVYRAVMNGYNSSCSLLAVEKEAAWYVLLAIEIIYIGYWCGEGNEEQLALNIKALNYIYQNKNHCSLKL